MSRKHLVLVSIVASLLVAASIPMAHAYKEPPPQYHVVHVGPAIIGENVTIVDLDPADPDDNWYRISGTFRCQGETEVMSPADEYIVLVEDGMLFEDLTAQDLIGGNLGSDFMWSICPHGGDRVVKAVGQFVNHGTTITATVIILLEVIK